VQRFGCAAQPNSACTHFSAQHFRPPFSDLVFCQTGPVVSNCENLVQVLIQQIIGQNKTIANA
jgi:hypothetical protein